MAGAAAALSALPLPPAPNRGGAAMAPREVVLNDDGGWCWFQDERALVHRGALLVGSVACGSREPARRGDIELTRYDLATGEIHRTTLHEGLEADDHAAPALLELSDGRVLATWTRHGSEARLYWRTTEGSDSRRWRPPRAYEPSPSTRITYSNLHRLSEENDRIYCFFRGLDDSYKPSWCFSDDGAASWKRGGILIDVPGPARHRPYVKYASDGRGAIHFLFTEAHPRNFDCSLYHAVYRDGSLHRSDGALIRRLGEGPMIPAEATRIHTGGPDSVAWCQDLALDSRGRPVAAYSVQVGDGGRPQKEHGRDHRYRYARWDGRRWLDSQIGYAGSRLYPGEDDYVGGISLHPDDPSTVFLSANVNPASGAPLPGGRWQVFQARTPDGGRTWEFLQLTRDPHRDCLRPIVPAWQPGRTALLWLRGRCHAYTRYELEVVLQVR